MERDEVYRFAVEYENWAREQIRRSGVDGIPNFPNIVFNITELIEVDKSPVREGELRAIEALRIYRELIERHPEFRAGEFSPSGYFPDLETQDSNPRDYVFECARRLRELPE